MVCDVLECDGDDVSGLLGELSVAGRREVAQAFFEDGH